MSKRANPTTPPDPRARVYEAALTLVQELSVMDKARAVLIPLKMSQGDYLPVLVGEGVADSADLALALLFVRLRRLIKEGA